MSYDPIPGPVRNYRFLIHGHLCFNPDARRRRAERQLPAGTRRPRELSLAAIAHSENLLATFRKLKAVAGQATGIDRIGYNDVSTTEIAAILRQASRAILDHGYRPNPTRLVRIPKGDGRFRELRIGTIVDRVVAAALYEALSERLDATLLPDCYGFRSGRSIFQLVATMKRIVEDQERHIIASDDISEAFPSVRIDNVMTIYRELVRDPDLLWLLETVLRGADGASRTVRIDQGNPMSPISMNVLVSECLDRPFSADPTNPPWLRWADNVLYLCHGVCEARQAIRQAAMLLATAGFRLKGEAAPTNLGRQGARRHVLGFDVKLGEKGLDFAVPNQAWNKLRVSLIEAHEGWNPSNIARSVVRGWLAAYGPALAGADAVRTIHQVLELAADIGFREIGNLRSVLRIARRSHAVWEQVRRSTVHQQSV